MNTTHKVLTFIKHLIIVFRGPLIIAGAIIIARFAVNATVTGFEFTLFTVFGNGILNLFAGLNFCWALIIAVRGGFHRAHREMQENKKFKK